MTCDKQLDQVYAALEVLEDIAWNNFHKYSDLDIEAYLSEEQNEVYASLLNQRDTLQIKNES